MPRRTKDEEARTQLLQAIKEFFATNGGASGKLLLGIGAIIVAMWTLLGLGPRISEAEQGIASNDVRLTILTTDVTQLAADVDDVSKDLADFRSSLSEAAVALDEVKALIEDLQKIRKELIEAANPGGG